MCTLMDGSNYVLMVILNLDATAEKESMFARDFSLKKTSKGNIFKVINSSQMYSLFPQCHTS